MHYYLVAPASIVRQDEAAFTYQSEAMRRIGSIVLVPVGRRQLVGLVLKEVTKPPFATKPIGELLAPEPLPAPLISLAQWMSEYYVVHMALTLQAILPAGLQKKRRQKQASSTPAATRKRTHIVLNPEQKAAIRAIDEHSSATLLLHGVPGSGKTRIYIEAAKRVLGKGQSSIVLVPEIALTPQLVAEFQHHFPRIIVTHSHMTEAERHAVWLQALTATEPLIIIGPRSALFMPVAELGLIVIDEAHEPSYKQDQSPRYSALRTASVLAGLHAHAKVILGSATPSVSDYYLAEHTGSSIVTLTKPAIALAEPQLEVIDLKRKELFREHRFIADALLTAIRQALHATQQTLIFHNRRGTAPTTLCTHCGWSALCTVCFVPMTLHADQHRLLCHICGRQQKVPPNCPICRHPNIVFRGIGTKMIEEELRKLFPKARIARFDADNSPEQTLDKRYQEIYDGSIDIMIGTQILAKGLDVPNLSVVGVMQADNGLHLPDYQAEERVFQLLYQVAGRVGRGGHAGHVIVQTYLPEHPTIKRALARDYSAFYHQQLTERRAGVFPPFTYLLKLTTSYKTETGAIRAAATMAAQLRSRYPDVTILGPTPAFYERLHNNYRWQLLLKANKRARLIAIARQIPPNWQVDIDAANLL